MKVLRSVPIQAKVNMFFSSPIVCNCISYHVLIFQLPIPMALYCSIYSCLWRFITLTVYSSYLKLQNLWFPWFCVFVVPHSHLYVSRNLSSSTFTWFLFFTIKIGILCDHFDQLFMPLLTLSFGLTNLHRLS